MRVTSEPARDEVRIMTMVIRRPTRGVLPPGSRRPPAARPLAPAAAAGDLSPGRDPHQVLPGSATEEPSSPASLGFPQAPDESLTLGHELWRLLQARLIPQGSLGLMSPAQPGSVGRAKGRDERTQVPGPGAPGGQRLFPVLQDETDRRKWRVACGGSLGPEREKGE